MSLLVKKEGILTTVQDLGRDRYRQFGINPGGVMDRRAVRLVNMLIGNAENCAVLEMHFPAGQFVFEKTARFAVGGADFSPELSGKQIENWIVSRADTGAVLDMRKKICGNRAYLAVKGGFVVDKWLESSSTSLIAQIGGFNGRRLRCGDRINFQREEESNAAPIGLRLGGSCVPEYSSLPTIRITAGPEFDRLTESSRRTFLTEIYRITPNSDRMGFRFTGMPLKSNSIYEILSSGVTFGTVQLLPDGQFIILMADHQTTGGYPRIATVISTDLSVLAQLAPGDSVRFQMVSIADAERQALRFEKELGFLRTGLRSKISSGL